MFNLHTGGHHKASQDNYSFGSYLVRDSEKVLPPPLPAAFLFFGSDLVGVMGLVRKKKNKLQKKLFKKYYRNTSLDMVS
jgi:hypothetical protein